MIWRIAPCIIFMFLTYRSSLQSGVLNLTTPRQCFIHDSLTPNYEPERMLGNPLSGLGTGGAPAAPSLFSGGLPMGKLPLQILTAFPATGYLGLNLSAAGMPITAMAKAAVYAAGVGLSFLVGRLYMTTATKVLFYIMTFAPPWYIFDCLQIIFDGAFDNNGFLLPLPIGMLPSGGGVGGFWTLTLPLMSLILAAISAAGGAILMKYLPPSMMGAGGKYAEYATLGGGALFGVIGIAGSFYMSSGSSVPGAIPVAIPPAPVPLAAAAPAGQQGGGLPPLSAFMKGLKKETSSLKLNSESITFLGLLGLIIIGGGTLGYLRSKSISP
jgi:hypothetical protein